MKIAVVGIGGIGGYYGGMLARYYGDQGDTEVVFMARGDHLKEIQSKGLRLVTAQEAFTVMPHTATDNPKEFGLFDLVLFCVKAYDLDESAALLKDNVSDHTVVITLLNGVDNAARLKAVFPEAQVLNGCVYLSAFIVEPGMVRQAGGSCKLFFGKENGEHNDYLNIENILKQAGIDATYSNDITTIVWEKYLFISPLASATSYHGKTLGELLKNSESKKLLAGLMREVELVARHQDVPLPKDICNMSLERVSSFPEDTKTSLQLDFERGKKTELDTFTGYILKYAETHGISTPLHKKVYDSLKLQAS